MKNIAVILAGGKGSRFGSKLPKQFVKLAGKAIIEYTIEVFENHSNIDEIIIAINSKYKNKIKEIIKQNNYKKISFIIDGGESRYDSTLNVINYLSDKVDKKDNILLHDAVRPFVSKRIIDDCLFYLNKYNAIDVAIDSADTLVKVKNFIIEDIPNRADFKRGQTPQCFKFDVLKQAYDVAEVSKEKNFTCDCNVVNKTLNEDIYVVKGDEYNIKITYPLDIYLAEKLIQMGVIDSVDFKNINLKNLENKNILIFGNSSGIGKEIEKIAKEYGANVYGASRKNGVNISNIEDIKNFLNNLNKTFDIVFVTAGELIKKSFDSLKMDEVLLQIQCNYIGVINVSKVIKSFLNQNSNFILFSSSSYTRGRKDYAIYSSSKAAIVNFTQALADEWANNNIKVNCVAPQRTLTPMRIKNFKDDNPEELLSAKEVAIKSLQLAISNFSGLILDIKKTEGNCNA